MTSFVFRLERILHWRRSALSIEQARLENLRVQARAVETARAQLERDRELRQREIVNGNEVSGKELLQLDAFREWAARQHVALGERAASLYAAIEGQAARVLAADRALRLLERLKERRREAWTAQENRELEALAGESAVAQWRGGAAKAGRLA